MTFGFDKEEGGGRCKMYEVRCKAPMRPKKNLDTTYFVRPEPLVNN
jgi:hypothetical protein